MLKSSFIFLVRSPLLHLLLPFATQYYSGTHSRGETSLPTRNGLLLCISQLAVYSWIFLLTEPYYCVTGAINFNKEDLTIMSGVTQDDDHQRSDVILSIWECDKVDRRGEKDNKECW